MENKKFTDFYEAYHFLEGHRLFDGRYDRCLYMEVVKVDPETRCVERDSTRNTKTEIWFEAGALGYHDLDLDCGGDTYEEATIALANLVYDKYGAGRLARAGATCQIVVDK